MDDSGHDFEHELERSSAVAGVIVERQPTGRVAKIVVWVFLVVFIIGFVIKWLTWL